MEGPVQVLIINQAEVNRLLPMHECIEVMAAALLALSRGDALQPLRSVLWLPERVGALGLMPSFLGDIGSFGLKAASIFPGNHGTEYDSHQGAVLLFEARHGRLLAIMDASAITAIRTAAVSAVATRALAQEDAGDLAILGSGIQARSHLQAMQLARSLRRVRVWSRDFSHAQSFAERESAQLGLRVEALPAAQEAVAGADLICTTTAARQPVLMGAWIAPGAHVNAVGSSVAFTRELDTAAVVNARLYVDCLESTLHEAGDFLFPRQEGAIDNSHIQGEIGAVLLGRVPARQSARDITLFKSLGLAVEDLAAAHHVYAKALVQGCGQAVELGGERR
jgi:ornithine cyclodeaminase